jgi:hypothetical protein
MKPRCKAGQNIRELELKRRIKAIESFGFAGLIIIVLPIFAKLFENLMKPLSTKAPVVFPAILYLIFGFISLLLILIAVPG